MSHDVLMIFVAIMWIVMNFAGASFAWTDWPDAGLTPGGRSCSWPQRRFS